MVDQGEGVVGGAVRLRDGLAIGDEKVGADGRGRDGAPQSFSTAFERDSEKRLRLKGRLKQEVTSPWWFRTVSGAGCRPVSVMETGGREGPTL
jgi:hypothetical protein